MTRNIRYGTVPARFLTCPPDCGGCADCVNSQFIYDRGVNVGRALHPFDPAASAAEVDEDAAGSVEAWMRIFRLGIAAGIRDDAKLEVTA